MREAVPRPSSDRSFERRPCRRHLDTMLPDKTGACEVSKGPTGGGRLREELDQRASHWNQRIPMAAKKAM